MIYELAGAVGVDPGPFTLRQLVWMRRGRSKADWDGWSSLIAAILTAADGKERDPADLNPHIKTKVKRHGRQSIPLNKDTIGMLKALIPKKK